MTKGERSLDRLVSRAQVIAVSQRFPTPSLVPIHDLDCSKLHARRTRRTHLPWHLRAVVRQDGGVYARVKDLELEPDPSALPGRPELFAFLARMVVGPPDSRGEELFDVTVCSHDWLAPGAGKWGFRRPFRSTSRALTSVKLRRWLESRSRPQSRATYFSISGRSGCSPGRGQYSPSAYRRR